MASFDVTLERRSHDPETELRHRNRVPKPLPGGKFRALGLGLITGAADDDPCAIGTYASAGAAFGPAILWIAPFAYPMMVAAVYLSSKLGQVAGLGLTAVVRQHYPRWVLYLVVMGVTVANLCGTAADIGGISAAANLILPVPIAWLVVPTTVAILSLQIFGSYELIRSVFRWIALALFAYVGAALLARPETGPIIRGTLVPVIHLDREFVTTLLAIIGTSLSPYLYIWEPDQQVSEDISLGRRRLMDRAGMTKEEQKHSILDVSVGMLFANLIIYFIILCTASTLFRAGVHNLSSASEAAQALKPLAGDSAGILFAAGLIGVGVLAIPVMTTGIASVICQAKGWKNGLHCKPSEAKEFYAIIVIAHLIAMTINFLGLNPMKALLWAGVVQGLVAPPLMLLTLLVTSNPLIMGRWANRRMSRAIGWITTGMTFAAAIGAVITWLHR